MHMVVNVRKYKHTVQTPICRLTEPERAQDAAPSALLKAEKKALISDKAAKAFLDEVIKYADSVYENGKK